MDMSTTSKRLAEVVLYTVSKNGIGSMGEGRKT